jgi:hypothetical protein
MVKWAEKDQKSAEKTVNDMDTPIFKHFSCVKLWVGAK